MLSDVGISKEFSFEVRNRYQILEVQQTTDIGAEVSVEEKWSHVKEAYHSTSKNIVGIKKSQHKELISSETLDCIKRRRTLKTLTLLTLLYVVSLFFCIIVILNFSFSEST